MPTEIVKNAVIYQINLRVFTKEGTFAAAEKFLPEVAATGADWVYLCPFVEADCDMDKSHWSTRQRRSNCENPRNPYRISDYFKIDSEYGDDESFSSFVNTAHKLNLKVMTDLVYMHAGPTFGRIHPDFVKKNADGTMKLNSYHFCEIDFESAELREHLWSNMEYFVREFDVDGFRCDVGGWVPLDFWVEGRRRCEAIKTPFMMLNENEIQNRPADQDKAFDINYCQWWTSYSFPDIFRSGMPAIALEMAWKTANDARPGAVLMLGLEHHDTANDMYYSRVEAISSAKCEAAYVLNYTVNGVPFLYNGCEHCDTSRHSIFGNKGQFFIDRSKDATARSAFLRRLAELHRTEAALRDGAMEWLKNSANDFVCTYLRTAPNGERVFSAVNFGNETVTAECAAASNFSGGEALLERGASLKDGNITLEANGFMVVKL